MIMKRINTAFFAGVLIATIAPSCHGQYSTDWVANTFGTNAAHVGNCARSMWVAPEGVVYTASMWDENEGGIAIYQNGQSIGSMGAHGELQGGAITGNGTTIFAALQFNTAYGSGNVGRYNRTSHTRDLIISVSATTTERRADVITGLATSGTLLYASDFPGNRVRVFTTDGAWQQDISVSSPGALAVDSGGNIWVAQKSAGAILEFSPSGAALNTIQMGASSRPSALYFDAPNTQLMVGDQGPDMNIKKYDITGVPTLAGTFGVQGGYLDTTTGTKGQAGAQRFTRVVGIGKDTSGNLYVLNNPWGGTWDLGRDGGTDIHSYSSLGALQWTLQSLNFEAVAAADSRTDGAYLYSGNIIYTGSGGSGYVGNTVDPIMYPTDPRINISDPGRGEHFGQLATVGINRILVASGQNPDIFYTFYFNAANGYIAIPGATLPGGAFGTTARVRNGFCLDANGDIWAGLDKTNAIWHYPLTGFDVNGQPIWGAGVSTSTPSTIAPLTRIVYVPATDTMILAQGIVGSTDWTSIGTRVEVYHGWLAGNTTAPNPVITLSSANPKSIAAAGNYLFVGYVHTVPNVDAFNLTTGSLDITLINSSPNTVYVGNDVDSMYGIRAYLRSTGEYLVTKDNYNSNSVVIYRWLPGSTVPAAPTSLTATSGNGQVSLSWTASSGATSYNVKRATVSGGPYTTIASATATAFTDTGLTNGTTYYYVVSALNSAGESANSAEVNVTPSGGDFTVSAAPGSQTVTAGTATTYTTNVTAVNGFTGTVSFSAAGLPSGASGTFNPTSVAGSGSSTLSVSTSSTTAAGTYTLTITGTSGSLVHSTTATLVVNAATGGLPSGWSDQDTGSVGIAGSATYNSGTFTVKGSGADIWGPSDAFNYAYKSSSGNVTVIARVASQQNTNAWAKAGVMIRETTAANSTYVFVFVTPGNGVNMQYRSSTGGSSAQAGAISGLAAPYWVGLVRSGNTFTGYASADGSSWTRVGSVSVTLPTSVLEGLAVTEHDNRQLNTSTFDNVTAP